MTAFKAVIFDLDGVVTKTAKVHAKAWKTMFDSFLKERSEKGLEEFKEFTHEEDYLPHVDGKPRYEGVQDFLKSRSIDIPFGSPDDEPNKETVCGLGNKKNISFRYVLDNEGVEEYPSTVRLIKELRSENIHVGVASSSKNCEFVLNSAGLSPWIETRVDGVVSADLGLKGKPDAAIFLKAAENMGVTADQSIVVEDAFSGVQAGVNGHFGLVIGLARQNNQQDLESAGADVVLEDFGNSSIQNLEEWFLTKKNQ